LCTGEGGDTWAYHKHIGCCSGLEEKLIDGRYICKKSSGGCTGENGDPWATGSFVPCCDGLEKVLINGHYKCIKPGPTPPSSYTNHFDPNNPLNVQVKGSRSDNYFIILGDWGKADYPGYC